MLPDHQFPIYWKAPSHNKPKRWHKVAFDGEMERDEKIHMEHVCSHDNRHHGRSLHVIKDSTVDFAPARTNLTQRHRDAEGKPPRCCPITSFPSTGKPLLPTSEKENTRWRLMEKWSVTRKSTWSMSVPMTTVTTGGACTSSRTPRHQRFHCRLHDRSTFIISGFFSKVFRFSDWLFSIKRRSFQPEHILFPFTFQKK